MKSTAVLGKHNKSERSHMDGIAKKFILKALNKIKVGSLVLEDGDETHRFGEADANCKLKAHIKVEDPALYRYVMSNGTIGSGEAYMQGYWSSHDLVQVIRLMVINMNNLNRFSSVWGKFNLFVGSVAHRLRANSKSGSKKNIAAHYDLGNDFFKTFLDETMLYSSAIYPEGSSSLYEASINKMQHICERLDLQKEDHLLEIGTGWGAMAIYAAQHFGCRVTSVTISKEQFELARERVKKEGLQDLVDIRLQDYRDIEGQFDKLVTIEMVEAVGYQYYSQFFSQCSSLLKPDGKMLMQAITIADQRYMAERDKVDFIQKYIFPGGSLPSIEAIAKHICADTNMTITGLEDITFHYARTLADWRKRFFEQIHQVREQGFDEVFIRMWDFYLCFCEGGFRERVIGTSQFLFCKPLCRVLPKVS